MCVCYSVSGGHCLLPVLRSQVTWLSRHLKFLQLSVIFIGHFLPNGAPLLSRVHKPSMNLTSVLPQQASVSSSMHICIFLSFLQFSMLESVLSSPSIVAWHSVTRLSASAGHSASVKSRTSEEANRRAQKEEERMMTQRRGRPAIGLESNDVVASGR